ncbi:hypothetical protein M3Y99_00875800 [Aphelenchoides fujianensis]|nr:hypothetical protein M3Y99_00875800 [Aphelenchoides fujianensis]
MNGLLVALMFLSFSTTNAIDKVEFLMRNQALCEAEISSAKPSGSPCWTSASGSAKDHEVCVENDELEQRCNKLPPACVDKWKQVSRPTASGGRHEPTPDRELPRCRATSDSLITIS